MSRFFIDRPIVAMVISIIMVIVGVLSMLTLPISQFPNIAPPEIQVQTFYPGADALTIEESVATPIEQQISGIQDMNYMYSLNSNAGQLRLIVDFDVTTDPDIDQILTQMRVQEANSELPPDVIAQGITVLKSTSNPLLLFALYSPDDSLDSTFLANYAYINLNDPLSQLPGIGQVEVFGAGEYAMRIWVRPDDLAKLDITITEIVSAVQAQNTVNPSGMIGGEPAPPGQEFSYAVQAQGRLQSAEEFEQIVVRAEADGSLVRVGDVARVELGSQVYNIIGRLNGKPAAILALYQLPDSNALETAKLAKAYMEKAKERFPAGLEYVLALDTTLAVSEGIEEIQRTLFEALALVILVVFVFLQGWRATLIPLLAVPVSLVATFALFPLLGFSINTLSLFGLVLAIGLVVDDAIVVVEAVEHHIELGLSPREAALKAMSEVSGPVVAIAIILAAVFLPTAFIPGITGRLYQQFAVTIAVSVIFSAFNALTLSPALSALLLRPKSKRRGPLTWFYNGFNKVFGAATNAYVAICHRLIRVAALSVIILAGISVAAFFIGVRIPTSFLPEEDQGYAYVAIQLPDASSLQRTDEVVRQATADILEIPGVQSVTAVTGFSLLSYVQNTYSGFLFVTLKPWSERKEPSLHYPAIARDINERLARYPAAMAFAFPPPAIPGVGTSGGVTFILQDRSGSDVEFLAQNTARFVEAARKRPELAMVSTTALLTVPQLFVDVDRDKVLKQGVPITDVYQTLKAYMGGLFVNFFNRFGRQWQVYIQAEGEYRSNTDDMNQFYVRNDKGNPVPLTAFASIRSIVGPEFTMRYNLHRSTQINAAGAPGVSSAQAMAALEEVFHETMPEEMGFGYMGMSFQEKKAQEGVSPVAIFAISLVFVFLILAAQYESWSLPFSVLLGTPIAVAGAFLALYLREMENNVYAQIGLVMLIGLAAKNAILIVEFAKREYDEGRELVDAALAGARLRLRPILMTAFAFILGCVPLAIAEGAGAISRQVMGTVVIGGMLAATGIAIFLVPVMFYIVERFAGHRRTPAGATMPADGGVAATPPGPPAPDAPRSPEEHD